MNLNQEKNTLDPVIDSMGRGTVSIDCTGLSGAGRAYLLYRAYAQRAQPLLAVCSNTSEAQKLCNDLEFFVRGQSIPVALFPAYHIMPFKFIGYHNETAARRIRILYGLLTATRPAIVITSVEGLLQRLIPRAVLGDCAELLMAGEETEHEALIARLIAGGYQRVVIVEEPGDFCVRGGIMDIFSPLYPDPIRAEWFGDTIETLRFFSATTQRSLGSISEAVILPARETVVERSHVPEILRRLRIEAAQLDMPVSKLRAMVDQVRTEGTLPEIAGLAPLVYRQMESLIDYLPAETRCVFIEPDALEQAVEHAVELIANNYENARREQRLCLPPERLYLDWEAVKRTHIARHPVMVRSLPVIGSAGKMTEPLERFDYTFQDNTTLQAAMDHSSAETSLLQPLVNWIADNRGQGNRCLLVCQSDKQALQMADLLAPYKVSPKRVETFRDAENTPAGVSVCVGDLSGGFVWPQAYLALVNSEEIFGVRSEKPRPPQRKAGVSLRFEDLKFGDLVVHQDHGIGRYQGLEKLRLDGTINDFLLIVYRDGDKLYLPVDRLAVVEKYMGVDGVKPVLDKMGGKSWERVKARVKRSAEQIAGELLKLYASRKVSSGFTFELTGREIREFESGFTYAETPDQLKAIEDVIQDMQRSKPMDRLICGDVGYGKTEVALRAAFLAVNNAKQVAVLVPTTVLAEQHYATFSKRFKRFPLVVACLSRFRSPRAQREIVKGVAGGTIDIVIGTHRLLSKDVGFKDLGLLVLDEEQRFGVKHKERFKRFRATVDVLTLTATPIPRTLHLSLTGIRDISIISTPPEYRQAIVSYICEYDAAVAADAIRNELRRGGQTFFVHNNINTIEPLAAHLQRLVPEARIAVAHGRMDEERLERVMLSFARREIDLLVCTTIIESGLDIPAANTMLINRADRFGLSQIYQLRGRIGRSEHQAYAYLFIPRESTLTQDARKRLKVLMEHSDLGSGFQIAMSDLKIRGGGTILGVSQSGHIAAVGYDMFLKLMQEAVAELKGQPVALALEPEINIDFSAYLPETFIVDIDQRLIAYRRLARMTRVKEINDFKTELADRFGPLPKSANHLLLKIMLRVLSIRAGIKKLDLNHENLVLQFSPAHQKSPFLIAEWVATQKGGISLNPEGALTVNTRSSGTLGRLSVTKNILKEIIRHVNS